MSKIYATKAFALARGGCILLGTVAHDAQGAWYRYNGPCTDAMIEQYKKQGVELISVLLLPSAVVPSVVVLSAVVPSVVVPSVVVPSVVVPSSISDPHESEEPEIKEPEELKIKENACAAPNIAEAPPCANGNPEDIEL